MEKSLIYSAEEVYKALIDFTYDFRKDVEDLEKLLDSETVLEDLAIISCGKISRRKRRLLTIVKIPFAVVGLTRLLGYPPDIRRISEAIDEPYIDVWRILGDKKQKKLKPEMLSMLNLRELKTKHLGLQKVALPKGTTYRWKRLGGGYIENDDVKGASNVYAHIKIREPLNNIPMLPSERKIFVKYLSESAYLDIYKKTILNNIQFAIRCSSEPHLTTFFHSIYSPIVKRIVEIVKREERMVSKDLEDIMSFNWMKPRFKLNNSLLNDISKRISDEDWRRAITSPTQVKGRIVEELGLKHLICSECGSKTPQGKSPKRYKCRVCGQELAM